MDYGNQLEHFSLRWNNFNDNMKSGFHDLLRTEDFVDVTIAAEGKLIQAHKMVLSVCSPYFKNIFKTNPCQHPVIFLKDVTHKELSGILQFMYLGEVSVQQEELGRFLKTAEALQIKGLTGDDGDCKDESSNETKENYRHPIRNKTKFVNNYDKETCVKKMKLSAVNSLDKKGSPTSPVQNQTVNIINNENHNSILCKTEQDEIEFSDEESDKVSLKEESVNESFLQLAESISEDRNDINESQNTLNSSVNNALSVKDLIKLYQEYTVRVYNGAAKQKKGPPSEVLSGLPGLPNEPFVMTEGNQEIRFVMSPRMRPCLVFNNYLYIKDHVGVASPGQPKTIYWRCKDITCKARCIQTDFKFRLKRNTYHQHRPNVDPSYFPIHLKRAYDVIRFLNGPENILNV